MKNNRINKFFSIPDKLFFLRLPIYVLFWMFLLSLGNYFYVITYHQDELTCMIDYVNDEYPKWCMYDIYDDWNTYKHIDSCNMIEEYESLWIWKFEWEKIWEANWCFIKQWWWINPMNTSYCATTYFMEHIVNYQGNN